MPRLCTGMILCAAAISTISGRADSRRQVQVSPPENLRQHARWADDQSPSWQKYIVGSQQGIVYPAAIYNTTGNVTNAEGLLDGSDSPAVLTRPSTDSTVPAIVVDFGNNTVGFLEIDFASSSDNHPGLRLAFSESLQYLSNVSDFSRSYNGDKITPGSDQIAVAATPYTWNDTNGCMLPGKNETAPGRVCADGLHGFRYLNIYLDALPSDEPCAQPNGTVSISGIRLRYSGLLAPYQGYFECSDPDLTRWWFAGVYTNEMTTDTFRADDVDPRDSASPSLLGKQVLFDGAKRDRDPYVGDIAVSALTDYYSHYSTVPALNILADLADHQRSDGWIPPASINNYTLPLFDYPFWWAHASWKYVLYTGDMDYANNYFDHFERLLNGWSLAVTNTSTGLLSKGLNGTGGYGDYAFLSRTEEITYYNTLYVLALQAGARIANLTNNSAQSADWTAHAATVSEAINANLWDASVGAYFDSSNSSTRHAQDGNSLAVLSGVADRTRTNASLAYLSTLAHPYGNAFMDNDDLVPDGTDRVYAFLSYFEIAARFESGDVTGALDEIKRLFGWMASHDPQNTFWEGISTNGSLYEGAYTSCAHGWSTGVTPALSQYVLGVEPVEPGYAVFSVTPRMGHLTWAKGSVPTPHGAVDVSWASDSSSFFALNLTLPEGTNGQVNLPLPFGGDVQVNGSDTQTTTRGQYVALPQLGPGAWAVTSGT